VADQSPQAERPERADNLQLRADTRPAVQIPADREVPAAGTQAAVPPAARAVPAEGTQAAPRQAEGILHQADTQVVVHRAENLREADSPSRAAPFRADPRA